MYRPPNPRFNNPPVGNRRNPYGPRPQLWTPDHEETSNVHSKNASRSVPPPARKAEFNLYDPYDAANSDPEEPQSSEVRPDNSTSSGRWNTDDRKKRRLSPQAISYPILQSGPVNPKDTYYRPPAAALSTAVRLSPPPSQLPDSYKQSSEADKAPPPHRADVKKDPGRGEPATPKSMISCDFCEVELSNGQELEEHLDCKTHWDTLEHIQTHNNYDDMTMAFLQDVMLYKSQKNNRAIEDNALPALQKYDHMTKVEMFHCAACGVFVPTSASAVQNHITSQGHMTNTKEFKVRQGRLCLQKAKTMMEQLTPQFMSFAKGGSPFDSPRNANSTS